ncbi:hypothetical protein DOTSEDRAFT_141225 [Dothistroma septosporum NZE10]|uniref:Uncharacterized protein n=1 Tax=Dothistroma septosporum (strain NZE10 / CBS 128990) TaxID=675120 RepID=M2XG92_DOTSN|nr:hypothetical protein DOTSEDRAFT_141225 [Dothistroma septosporum NZE10]
MPFFNDGTPKRFHPLAILPVLVVATAFILSFLCVFAGSKPGMMDDYAVFTLNTSRIGENLVQEFDNKIQGFNTSSILSKRSEPEHAFEAVKTAIVHEVNDAYLDFIHEMDLKGFYAVHLMTTCEGQYLYPNGTNYTINLTAPDPRNGTLHGKVSTCEDHSALNPLSLVKALYWVGIVFTGFALGVGVWGAVRYSRKLAILNVLATIPGLMFIALASAATHAFAAGAAGLVNFVGHGIGISGQSGGKFIALTWATTCLLLVNMLLWSLLAVLGERVMVPKQKSHLSEKGALPMEEDHEMRIRHPHMDAAA